MKENFEQKNELASFQAEMLALRDAEMAGKILSAHFMPEKGKEFDPSELTEEDMEIWKKVEQETITIEDFQEYKDRLFAEEMASGKEEEEIASSSRGMFVAFVANKITPITNRSHIEELRGQK